MQLRQSAADASQTFVSAKAARPIPHAGGLVGDALVQQSLDPSVRAIDFLRPAGPPAAEVGPVITVSRDDGEYYLDVVPARALRTVADQDAFEAAMAARGLSPLILTGAEIMVEPRFSTARAVWTYRRLRVPPDMRFRLLAVLEEEDGTTTLDELCRRVPGPLDPFSSVMALACADEVAIDLASQPLGPKTMVRSRA
jgi:hypothetical protein